MRLVSYALLAIVRAGDSGVHHLLRGLSLTRGPPLGTDSLPSLIGPEPRRTAAGACYFFSFGSIDFRLRASATRSHSPRLSLFGVLWKSYLLQIAFHVSCLVGSSVIRAGTRTSCPQRSLGVVYPRLLIHDSLMAVAEADESVN